MKWPGRLRVNRFGAWNKVDFSFSLPRTFWYSFNDFVKMITISQPAASLSLSILVLHWSWKWALKISKEKTIYFHCNLIWAADLRKQVEFFHSLSIFPLFSFLRTQHSDSFSWYRIREWSMPIDKLEEKWQLRLNYVLFISRSK